MYWHFNHRKLSYRLLKEMKEILRQASTRIIHRSFPHTCIAWGTQHRRLHNSKRNRTLNMTDVLVSKIHTSSKMKNKESRKGNRKFKRVICHWVACRDRLFQFHFLDNLILHMGLSCYKGYCTDLSMLSDSVWLGWFFRIQLLHSRRISVFKSVHFEVIGRKQKKPNFFHVFSI